MATHQETRKRKVETYRKWKARRDFAERHFDALEAALRQIEQRSNESSNDPMGERETIHAVYRMARAVLAAIDAERSE